jgi:hypothetical protein
LLIIKQQGFMWVMSAKDKSQRVREQGSNCHGGEGIFI